MIWKGHEVRMSKCHTGSQLPLRMLKLRTVNFTQKGAKKQSMTRKLSKKYDCAIKGNLGGTSDVKSIVKPAVWHVMMSVEALAPQSSEHKTPQKPLTKAFVVVTLLGVNWRWQCCQGTIHIIPQSLACDQTNVKSGPVHFNQANLKSWHRKLSQCKRNLIDVTDFRQTWSNS